MTPAVTSKERPHPQGQIDLSSDIFDDVAFDPGVMTRFQHEPENELTRLKSGTLIRSASGSYSQCFTFVILMDK